MPSRSRPGAWEGAHEGADGITRDDRGNAGLEECRGAGVEGGDGIGVHGAGRHLIALHRRFDVRAREVPSTAERPGAAVHEITPATRPVRQSHPSCRCIGDVRKPEVRVAATGPIDPYRESVARHARPSLSCPWERIGAGVPADLQNRDGRRSARSGRFDSYTLPPAPIRSEAGPQTRCTILHKSIGRAYRLTLQ